MWSQVLSSAARTPTIYKNTVNVGLEMELCFVLVMCCTCVLSDSHSTWIYEGNIEFLPLTTAACSFVAVAGIKPSDLTLPSETNNTHSTKIIAQSVRYALRIPQVLSLLCSGVPLRSVLAAAQIIIMQTHWEDKPTIPRGAVVKLMC